MWNPNWEVKFIEYNQVGGMRGHIRYLRCVLCGAEFWEGSGGCPRGCHLLPPEPDDDDADDDDDDNDD